MKLKYEKGKFKLVYIAETAEDGFDISQIVADAAEDGITLAPRRHEGKILLETELLRRSRATPKKKTGTHEDDQEETREDAPPESKAGNNGPAIPVGENA